MSKKKSTAKEGAPLNIIVDTLRLADLKQPCEVQLIHYTKLVDNAKNRYSTEGIEALADSMQTAGVLQPLLVKVAGDGVYVITAGHRRRLAIAELVEKRGREEFVLVPCIVSSADEDETITELKLHLSNTNRTFSDYDKMFAISELERLFNEAKKKGIKISGKIRENIGEAMGLGPTQVQKYLTTARELSKATEDADEIKKKLQEGMIGITEVYSMIRPKQPDSVENGEDSEDRDPVPVTPAFDSSFEKNREDSSENIGPADKAVPQPLPTQQHATDESLSELKMTLDEARKGLNAFKKMLDLLEIPGLDIFVRNLEEQLEKIEKKYFIK